MRICHLSSIVLYVNTEKKKKKRRKMLSFMQNEFHTDKAVLQKRRVVIPKMVKFLDDTKLLSLTMWMCLCLTKHSPFQQLQLQLRYEGGTRRLWDPSLSELSCLPFGQQWKCEVCSYAMCDIVWGGREEA